jgi:hypothetical protein
MGLACSGGGGGVRECSINSSAVIESMVICVTIGSAASFNPDIVVQVFSRTKVSLHCSADARSGMFAAFLARHNICGTCTPQLSHVHGSAMKFLLWR